MAYTRTNRKTKSKIVLQYFSSKVWDDCIAPAHVLVCESHKRNGPMFKKRSDALAQMSKPWLWCEMCENNYTRMGTISEKNAPNTASTGQGRAASVEAALLTEIIYPRKAAGSRRSCR